MAEGQQPHSSEMGDHPNNFSHPSPHMSPGETTTPMPGTLNVPVIVTGVFVPIILIVAIIVTIYIWYRRKYPVRMVIGKDFNRFSNPAYNKRASTLTLVRDDALANTEADVGNVNRGLTLIKEDDIDGEWTDIAHVDEAVNNSTSDDNQFKSAGAVQETSNIVVEEPSTADIVRDRPKRALLIKENFEDKDFDLVTESDDLSQRTESEISSGNDSTGTHTISLNFSETFDNRRGMSKSVDDLSSARVKKASKSKSFAESSAPVDIDELTGNLPNFRLSKSVEKVSERESKEASSASPFGSADSVYGKIKSPLADTHSETDEAAYGHSHSLDSLDRLEKLNFRENRIGSVGSNSSKQQFKTDFNLNKKRPSLTLSTEKIVLESETATPTVILQDSIIYESDITSPVRLETFVSPRQKRSKTLGDTQSLEVIKLLNENKREWHSVAGYEGEKSPLAADVPSLSELKRLVDTTEGLNTENGHHYSNDAVRSESSLNNSETEKIDEHVSSLNDYSESDTFENDAKINETPNYSNTEEASVNECNQNDNIVALANCTENYEAEDRGDYLGDATLKTVDSTDRCDLEELTFQNGDFSTDKETVGNLPMVDGFSEHIEIKFNEKIGENSPTEKNTTSSESDDDDDDDDNDIDDFSFPEVQVKRKIQLPDPGNENEESDNDTSSQSSLATDDIEMSNFNERTESGHRFNAEATINFQDGMTQRSIISAPDHKKSELASISESYTGDKEHEYVNMNRPQNVPSHEDVIISRGPSNPDILLTDSQNISDFSVSKANHDEELDSGSKCEISQASDGVTKVLVDISSGNTDLDDEVDV